MAKLCLVGEPSIVLDGERLEVSPRASLELLALIVLRYPAAISRTECAELLFKHIEELSGPAAARQQFRIALSKLRKALADAKLGDQFQLDGEDLELTTPWEVDIRQPLQAKNLAELRSCFHAVAPHWDHDWWHPVRTEYADLLSQRLCEMMMGCWKRLRANPSLVREFRELGALGAELFPLEPGFVRVQVALAEIEGNRDRAATLQAEFATRWSQQFPSTQVPPVSGPSASTGKQGRTRSRRMLAGVAATIALVSIVATLYARGRQTPAAGGISIEQFPTKRLVIDGKRYTLRKYRLPQSDPPLLAGAWPKTDGSGFLLLSQRDVSWSTELDGAQKRTAEPWTEDYGQVRFRSFGTRNGWLLGWESSAPKVKFEATPEYPRVSMPIHLGNGLFYCSRICGHSFGCHYESFYLKDGTFVPLLVDGVKPQTIMLFFADAKNVYGMYSLGKADGWKYHPFVTDRATLSTRNNGEDFAIGRFADGTWLCSPKETRLIRGDYAQIDTKEVVVVQPNGYRNILHRNAKSAYTVGEVIVVGVDEPASNNFFTHTEFYDRNGERIKELDAIGSRLAYISTDMERRHMTFIPFGNNPSIRTAYVLSAEE